MIAEIPPGDGGEWIWQAAYQVLGKDVNAFYDLWTECPRGAVQALTDREAQAIRGCVEQYSFDLPGGESGGPVQDCIATMDWITTIRRAGA